MKRLAALAVAALLLAAAQPATAEASGCPWLTRLAYSPAPGGYHVEASFSKPLTRAAAILDMNGHLQTVPLIVEGSRARTGFPLPIGYNATLIVQFADGTGCRIPLAQPRQDSRETGEPHTITGLGPHGAEVNSTSTREAGSGANKLQPGEAGGADGGSSGWIRLLVPFTAAAAAALLDHLLSRRESSHSGAGA